MWKYPHYEVVISSPNGVAWWGRVETSSEASAKSEALRQYRRSRAMTYGANDSLYVETNLMRSPSDESIL